MAEYRLLTEWHIDAPLDKVYAAILDSQRWPDWWSSVRNVERVTGGDARGIDSVWRYSWQGRLPYQVVFEVCVTRIENMLAIEGSTQGDLEGTGRWEFSRQGTVSVVRCEWHVRSTRWWMNLLTPFARPMFIRNHARVMERGAEGLARLLRSPLVRQETSDLMAVPPYPQLALGRRQERGRIDPSMAIIVGLSAGVIVTVVQVVLWWLAGMPLPEIFFRDARLTAALIMGSDVLLPPSTPRWDILLVATLIHFALSVAYALLPAHMVGRLRTGPTLFAGALYGLVIYVVNLYGLTLFFPWFAVARGWVTLMTHLVFGVVLAEGCRLFARSSTVSGWRAAQGSVMSG